MLRMQFHTAAIAALMLSLSTGCATKGFVRNTVADVNDRVDGIEDTVDRNVSQTERNTAHLDEVDRTARVALDTASSADTSAQHARDAAGNALVRTEALEAANRQLIFEAVISEGYDAFGFGHANLPDQAIQDLDALVEQLHAHDTAVHLEIEGHTDATGPTAYNQRLGLERAEAVKHYLYEKHRIPLHKMNVISFGEQKPIASNDTKEGRAKNRRVVVRVLASDPPPTASARRATS